MRPSRQAVNFFHGIRYDLHQLAVISVISVPGIKCDQTKQIQMKYDDIRLNGARWQFYHLTDMSSWGSCQQIQTISAVN